MQHDGLVNPIEVVGTNYLLRIGQNACKLRMTRCYYSVAYKAFYIGIVLLSALLLLYFLFDVRTHPAPWSFVAGEVVVSVLVCADLVFVAALQGWKAYFTYWKNLIDFGVAITCLGLIVASAFLQGFSQHLDEALTLGLLGVRTVVQYVRLLILVKNLRKTEQSIIDLNEMEGVVNVQLDQSSLYMSGQASQKPELPKESQELSSIHV